MLRVVAKFDDVVMAVVGKHEMSTRSAAHSLDVL